MPWTKKQKGLFGADIGRAEHGQPTVTGMDLSKLKQEIQKPTLPPVTPTHRRKKFGTTPVHNISIDVGTHGAGH